MIDKVTLLKTLSEAVIAIAQAGIGAYLGYLLGIRTFKLQTETSKKLSEDNAWQSAFAALGQNLHAVAADLNATANLKNQIISHLVPEAETIDRCMHDFYVNTGSLEKEAFNTAFLISQKSLTFFKSIPVIFPMQHPPLYSISLFLNDMPSLSLFLHNANTNFLELNERIKNRNRLVEDFSRENATGMQLHRIAYYLMMLSSEAIAISKATDAALGFQKLSIEQIEAFMATKGKERKVPIFLVELSEQAVSALPPESFLAEFRKGLKTFKL